LETTYLHFYTLDKESLEDFFTQEHNAFFERNKSDFFLGSRDDFFDSYLDLVANVMSLAGDEKYNALADITMLNHRLDVVMRERMKKISNLDEARSIYRDTVRDKLFA